MQWKLWWDDGNVFPSFLFLNDFDDASEESETFEHSHLVYLKPTNWSLYTTSNGWVMPWLLTPSFSSSSCLVLVRSLIFVPVIGISKSPIESILCDDETERKSTYFTSSFDLERTDEGISSSVVGGSLVASTHSPTSFLTYPKSYLTG